MPLLCPVTLYNYFFCQYYPYMTLLVLYTQRNINSTVEYKSRCYSYERLQFLPEINQRIREGQKCGYSFVMPILDGQSYAIVQEKNPLHHKTSLSLHVILTRDYDFSQKSIRKYAKGKNTDARFLCRYWMVNLT